MCMSIRTKLSWKGIVFGCKYTPFSLREYQISEELPAQLAQLLSERSPAPRQVPEIVSLLDLKRYPG